jgi:(p)ppGpp synthase/HD superfamily hydrolase
MSVLGKAIRIAAQSHEKQTDRGGNAYILHPIRIMMRLRTTDEEIMSMAILHDVIEDDPEWTIERLRAEGFSERVCAGLQCLTHPKDEPYEEYIKRIATNADAVDVKLEDIRDNSDITRLKGLRQKDFERIEKYHRAYLFLLKVKAARLEVYG